MLGRPVRFGFNLRPKVPSNRSTNSSPPSGRPLAVARLSCAISAASSSRVLPSTSFPIRARTYLLPRIRVQQTPPVAALDVRSRARPLLLGRLFGPMRPHRVEAGVAQRCPKMIAVQRTREESVPLQVPRPAPAFVHGARVKVMGPAQSPRKGIGPLRDCQEMHMIGHQAIAQQPHSLAGALQSEQPTVSEPAVVVEEGWLAVVAPLCEVVRHAHRHHPSQSGQSGQSGQSY